MESESPKAVLEELLNKKNCSKSDFRQFKRGVKFADIRLQIVKQLYEILKTRPKDQQTGQFMTNTLLLVDLIVNENNFTDQNEVGLESPGGESQACEPDPKISYLEFKRHFTQLWSEVMKWEKTRLIHKRILVLLPDKIIQHLTKPLHTSDYFLSAFDFGGPLSLLALQGIFVLMTKYNFEVADFYKRLYSLFQPTIFHTKYKARFMVYSTQFLRSTHLPEYLVGAFVKRMARLSLHAPTPCLPMIFDFITNIIIEHPGLKTMVHKEESMVEFKEDPFLENEEDPFKTRALESTLWEIKTLQKHPVPAIAAHAQFIERPLPKVEKDLDDTLDYTYTTMYQMEADRKKNAVLTSVNETLPEHVAIVPSGIKKRVFNSDNRLTK